MRGRREHGGVAILIAVLIPAIVAIGLGLVLVGRVTSLHQRYPEHPPFVITENGASYNTAPGDGDADRIAYLDLHLRQVERAVADGVDVAGYYCWSLMDNFEWAEGYTQRFGLVHIDYDTLVRTPRDSFEWYASVIADHKSRR